MYLRVLSFVETQIFALEIYYPRLYLCHDMSQPQMIAVKKRVRIDCLRQFMDSGLIAERVSFLFLPTAVFLFFPKGNTFGRHRLSDNILIVYVHVAQFGSNRIF